jgi:hypothetical protein
VYSRGALKSSACCGSLPPPNGDQPVELAWGISKAQLPVRPSGAGGSSAGGGPLGANDCQAGAPAPAGGGEGCAHEGSSGRPGAGSP